MPHAGARRRNEELHRLSRRQSGSPAAAAQSFHADIGECSACHLEHQGRVASTTKMDHVALARIGIKQLERDLQRSGADVAQIKRWLEETKNSPNADRSRRLTSDMVGASHSQPSATRGSIAELCELPLHQRPAPGGCSATIVLSATPPRNGLSLIFATPHPSRNRARNVIRPHRATT